MNILVIGSGAREHALALYFSAMETIHNVLVCPGNAGMKESPKVSCYPLAFDQTAELISLIREHCVSFVVVGPEAPLCAGLVDTLIAADIPVVGPSKEAAQLEGSKAFAKHLMKRAGVPTADFAEFTTVQEAIAFIERRPWASGYVVKADSLAAGKGVIVCSTSEEAIAAVKKLMEGEHLGWPVAKIIIEERLEGREVSSFYLCLEDAYYALGHACDYKRLEEGNTGPNTGGMGAYSPVSWLQSADKLRIEHEVVAPILQQMLVEKNPYTGFLFVGSMITAEGPRVLEFNVRLGDPETQVILPLLDQSAFQGMEALARRDKAAFLQAIASSQAQPSNKVAVHIVCAAAGYPGTEGEPVRLGDIITKNKAPSPAPWTIVYGGVRKAHGQLLTNGGRVFGATGLGASLAVAREAALAGVSSLRFDGMQFRRDIGE